MGRPSRRQISVSKYGRRPKPWRRMAAGPMTHLCSRRSYRARPRIKAQMTAASRAVPRRTLRARFDETRLRWRRRARATSGPGQVQQELGVRARPLADVVQRDALVVAVHAPPFLVAHDERAPAVG